MTHLNYKAIALGIAKKRFPHLWESHRSDVLQECALLEVEAQKLKRIRTVIKSGYKIRDRHGRFCGGAKPVVKIHGNGKDTMGLKSFSRAAYVRLYNMSVRYGYFRPKGCKYYIPRWAWKWGLRD